MNEFGHFIEKKRAGSLSVRGLEINYLVRFHIYCTLSGVVTSIIALQILFPQNTNLCPKTFNQIGCTL